MQFAAAFEGAAEREFIGEFKARARWQTMGDAGDFDIRRGEAFGEVEAGGVAFDIGAQRKDDFADWLVLQSSFEFHDAQVFGFDAVQGRDAAAEDMKFAAKSAGAFDADDIHRAFDDADKGGIALRVGTDFAGALLGEGAADFAITNAVSRFDEHGCQLTDSVGVGLNEVHGKAFGGTRANAGETVEGRYEINNRLREGGQFKLLITNYQLPIALVIGNS